MPQQLNIGRKLVFAPGAIVEGSWNGSFDTNGRIYYVNNMTGAATNGGLSWNNAMDEVSTAVTASNAWLALQPNPYMRTTIVVQGGTDPYDTLTTLPNYCTMIGIGNNPYGWNYGSATLGAYTGAHDGINATGNPRGLSMINMHMEAGNAKYAFSVDNISCSDFEDCNFAVNGDPGGNPAAGFRASGNINGVVMTDCHWGNHTVETSIFNYGIHLGNTHFHQCMIRYCSIVAKTAGIYVPTTCQETFGSVVRDCTIGGNGGQALALGIDDRDVVGNILYVNNYIHASTTFTLAVNAGRAMGNWDADGSVNGDNTHITMA